MRAASAWASPLGKPARMIVTKDADVPRDAAGHDWQPHCHSLCEDQCPALKARGRNEEIG